MCKPLPIVWLMFGVLGLSHLPVQGQVIERMGWDYDRADLNWPDWSDPQKSKKQGNFRGANGYLEFDVAIERSNWYELWVGGVPTEWSRNLYVDGKPIFVEGVGSQDDVLPIDQRRRSKVDFKEVNLYLQAGQHTLRFERLGFPGALPSAWQLRLADQQPEQCVAGIITSSRIVPPGHTVTLELTASAYQPVTYQLKLTDQITGKVIDGPSIDIPQSMTPVMQTVQVPLTHEGFYLITAKVNGQSLRPSDMKAGYVLATPLKDDQNRTTSVSDLSLNGLFTDRAVLQRDKPLPVWGKAPSGDTLIVELADQKKSTTADLNGNWHVIFAPMQAGGPHELTVTDSKTIIKRRDILIGEVWLLSGQSNMGGPILQCLGGKEAASHANMPDVRLGFVYGQNESGQIADVGWMQAVAHDGNPNHLKRWIAIHYAFGKALHESLNVPIGLIAANRGGTVISTWVPESSAKNDPAFKAFYDQFWIYNAPANRQNRYLVELASDIRKWKKKLEKTGDGKKPAPPTLKPDMAWRNKPGQHYHSLIEPCAPYAMRGVLWYQGESDSKMAAIYPAKFKRMITDWRKAWGNPNMPFITVQISYGSGRYHKGSPDVDYGAELRQMQLKCASLPDVYMVASHDLMRPADNVHYLDKLPVGRRLALAAQAEIYGKDVLYHGPEFDALSIEGNQARVHFKHAEGGLKIKGEQLNGFAIAGADKQWHWADAKIDGQQVIVTSDQVASPIAVRYGWSGYRNANLFNGVGLPAPTFRTDDWPLASEGVTFNPTD